MSDMRMIWLLAELASEERKARKAVYRCPGTNASRNPVVRRKHGNGCCATFAALPEAEQQQTGLRVPRRWT